MFQDHTVYALSAKGEQELRGGKTTLSPLELELLVRMNGDLTLGQIRLQMPAVDAKLFTSAFYNLQSLQLLTVQETDPFASRFMPEFDESTLALVGPEADSGALSLRRTGYYVSIARSRGTIRARIAGEKYSAIVVEDDPMLAKFIASYLSMDGFNVRRAGNRAEVLAEFRQLPIPDLILLDVTLPDIDGFDILLRLRKHPAFKDVSVVMLTGKATREHVLKGLACGADGYVTKPFEAEVLMRAVNTVMGRQQSPSSDAGYNQWSNADTRLRQKP